MDKFSEDKQKGDLLLQKSFGFLFRTKECSNKHQAELLNCLSLRQCFHVPNGLNVLMDGKRKQTTYSNILFSWAF